SPGGAAVGSQGCEPLESWAHHGVRFQGLTPLATDGRPSGANTGSNRPTPDPPATGPQSSAIVINTSDRKRNETVTTCGGKEYASPVNYDPDRPSRSDLFGVGPSNPRRSVVGNRTPVRVSAQGPRGVRRPGPGLRADAEAASRPAP